jgi:hypothetical protein
MTDARSVTVVRTYDAADRVTLVDYPDSALDTSYTYDDPGVPFACARPRRLDPPRIDASATS